MDLMSQECSPSRSRLENEEDQTRVEYDLTLALIAVVAMAAVVLLEPKISGMFPVLTGALP
jgi:Flp pilus assembly pilin Flp